MRTPSDDVKLFLSKMTPYISADGARNLNKVSRELDIPYQTLRFRMLRLAKQGIGILPLVSAESLGLERIRASMRISKDVKDPQSFFTGLHQTAGLHYFARTMFEQDFDSEFMIPAGTRLELTRLLNGLQEMGVVKDFVLRRLDWKEILMMKTELYDYEQEQWDVDYSSIASDPSMKLPSPNPSDRFDHVDLLIVKSLQLDPWVKVVDLAKKFNMTEGDVSYHVNRHVFGRRQVPGFRLRWVGTKEAWSKHSILGITTVFKDLTEESFRRAMAIVTSNPFAWNHMRAEDGTYISELLVPTPQIPETFQHLSDGLRSMDLKPQIMNVDWACSNSFTIPYMMHDEQLGWTFNAEKSLASVLQTLQSFQKA